MRVRVDADLCQGHGVCVSEAPAVFQLEDDGPVTILLESPPAELRAKIADALRYCPTGAISLEE
jgi:ferredoxin